MAVHKVKETLTLNRPAYVGMCILDLSKMLMYDFHYKYRSAVLMTSTTSMIMEQAVMHMGTTKYNNRHQSFY